MWSERGWHGDMMKRGSRWARGWIWTNNFIQRSQQFGWIDGGERRVKRGKKNNLSNCWLPKTQAPTVQGSVVGG